MSHWRCCCGEAPGGCCGCGGCPSIITFEAVESWTLAWTCGGDCDFSRTFVRTMVATFVRTTDPENSCPSQPGDPCPGACEWLMTSGTLTVEEAWVTPDAKCDTDELFDDQVFDLTVDGDSFARQSIRCGTCGVPADETDVWRIEIRQSASVNRFQVRSVTGNISVCPSEIVWQAHTVPEPPADPGICFEIQDYEFEWSLS